MSKRCMGLMIVGLCLWLVSAGCQSSATTVPVGDPSDTTVYVLADEDRVVHLHVGQILQVALPENPSTGYCWSTPQITGDAVVLQDDAGKYEPAAGNRPGSAGTRLFRFLARVRGQATLQSSYRRPWVSDAPSVREYVLQVQVH